MFPAADLSLKIVFQNTTKHENIRSVYHPGKNRQMDYFFIMLPTVFVFKICLLPSAKKIVRFRKLLAVFLLENCNIKNAAIHMFHARNSVVTEASLLEMLSRLNFF